MNLLKSMLDAEKDGWTSKEDIELWFDYLFVLLRDVAVLKISGDSANVINIDLLEFLQKISKYVDLKVIIKVQKELVVLRDKLIFNLNKSITWNYAASLLRKELPVRNA